MSRSWAFGCPSSVAWGSPPPCGCATAPECVAWVSSAARALPTGAASRQITVRAQIVRFNMLASFRKESIIAKASGGLATHRSPNSLEANGSGSADLARQLQGDDQREEGE